MKNKRQFITIMIAAIAFAITSCGGSKPVSVVELNEEVEVSVPCGDYYTDATFFRGQGIGQSKDLNTAREKARMAANTELAGSMSTWIKQLSERYVNDAGQNPADYSEIFESLTRQKVDEQISNIIVVCNNIVKTKDNMYRVYLAVEADRKNVFESFDKSFAADSKLRTLYDKERFRKVFDEEMDSFKSQNYPQ